MLKRRLLCLAATAVLATFVLPTLGAEDLKVDLDSEKTKVDFVVSDVLHTVRGTFHLKEGRIAFDPSTGVIAGEVIVNAASGSSGSRMRDKRMARDILEAQRYPEIRFTPNKMAGTVSTSSTSNIEITGSFLIHGQTHEITIPMQVRMSHDEITATGKFTVPYVQWGMKNPSNFLVKVNDTVEIEVSAIGHLESR